ncbi:MAG: addiction module protein [Rickettsiaceae bacterium]|jgi:Fic family protein|nr:addiction module protein [Rickettsiaceae bacterium]
MTFNRNTPYNDLPLLPPGLELETKNVMKAVVSASRALASLKTRGEHLPNQSLLIDSLVLLEAKDSSEIESIFTTHDALYQAHVLESSNIDPHTKEVENYRKALWHGVNSVKERPLNANTFIEIVQIIKKNQSEVRKATGTKIVIPLKEIIYTPPEGYDLIYKLLSNLENYLHKNDNIDPLIKMAVIHYQFEAIHPFSDGNGRTGRILNILYLLQEKLLDVPILFISNYILRNKTLYYKGLQNVTENNDWEGWIIFMLKAIEITSNETIARIDAIRDAMQIYKMKMEKDFSGNSKELLEILFEQPYCTIQSLIKRGIAKRVTASSYLKKLHNIGLLESKKVGRNAFYINPVLLNILSKPAEQLTRK